MHKLLYSEKVEKVGIIWQSVTKILDTQKQKSQTGQVLRQSYSQTEEFCGQPGFVLRKRGKL